MYGSNQNSDGACRPARILQHNEGSVLKKLLIFAVGIYTMLMLAGLVFAQASAGKLAARSCSTCHGTGVICEKLGERNAFAWANTVARMQSNGAKLSEADAATIAEYLATAKPGSKHLCK